MSSRVFSLPKNPRSLFIPSPSLQPLATSLFTISIVSKPLILKLYAFTKLIKKNIRWLSPKKANIWLLLKNRKIWQLRAVTVPVALDAAL